ncbi:serpentine type 7TM GPCR chemoreceptor srt domain-containing protein [Ditylenchus destructor]|uniref:Serpentine type 7TM GPCR chemoreceptor srt domain-containing protein n=1 Tax=Ditylenchus destructor TaxID=166010 RepID=A0AAD4MPD3_9BILA|nr:serpentine type 7TM GPCR chemoreceptor srt domain-containing protein [Ditylenchus destructor]
MNTYLFDRVTYEKYYNCSAYETDEIPLAERRHIVLGSIHIGCFFILEPLYLLCLSAIRKRLDAPCYKIMFFMGVMDVLCLPIIGLLHGCLGIIGAVFCTAPDLIYISGCVAMGLWVCEGMASVLLALNRCFEIALPNAGETIFRGSRTWAWISASLTFGTLYGFFGRTILFSSTKMVWLFEPHVGYLPAPEPNWYFSRIAEIYDSSSAITLTSLYVIFAFVLRCKISRTAGNGDALPNLKKSQKMAFLQALVLSIIHINASVVYCYIQVFGSNQVMTTLGMLGWFFAHGSPPVIYLTLNKSIRNDCLRTISRTFKCHRIKPNIITVSTIRSVKPVYPSVRECIEANLAMRGLP